MINMQERLQKYIAKCGVASRRKAETLILQGRVKVNGITISEMGYKIEDTTDKVTVDNELITLEENKVYIALNKPEGYVSTVSDERGRKTILDLVEVNERIYPIGRLDYDTSGLIILTNDGDIYNKLIHPRQQVNKVYIANVNGVPSTDEIKRFCNGIDIGDYITAESSMEIVNITGNNCEVKITIHEGKNRQVRRMCDAIYHPVINLKRISVGAIVLGGLPKGEWRFLNKKEVNYLNSL